MFLFRRAFLASYLAAPLLVLAGPVAAHDDQILDISGSYTAQGRNADGTPYHGKALLVQNGAQVQVGWTVGAQAYAGTGVLQGRILTVNWGSPTPMIYVVVGRELHGTWDGGRALERLIRD
jgi:hypothetical protein